MVSPNQPPASPDPPEAAIRDDDQAAIDEALQLLYSQYHRLGAQLSPESPPRLSAEQLRHGPLADTLTRLAQIAAGTLRAERAEILAAVDAVVQVLFWPPAASSYTVDRAFYQESALGRMLAEARFRAYAGRDLVPIGEAATMLRVARPTIYRWIDERALTPVYDPRSGRTFVAREDLETLRRDRGA